MGAPGFRRDFPVGQQNESESIPQAISATRHGLLQDYPSESCALSHQALAKFKIQGEICDRPCIFSQLCPE